MNNEGQSNASRETGLACAVTFLQPNRTQYRLAADTGPDFSNSHGFTAGKRLHPNFPYHVHAMAEDKGLALQSKQKCLQTLERS